MKYDLLIKFVGVSLELAIFTFNYSQKRLKIFAVVVLILLEKRGVFMRNERRYRVVLNNTHRLFGPNRNSLIHAFNVLLIMFHLFL